MNLRYVAPFAVLAVAVSGNALAGQCRDPWVTKAVTEVMHRSPNGSGESGECSIYRYGNGHWTSYADLVNKVKIAFGQYVVQARPIAPNRNYMNNQNRSGFYQPPASGVIAAGGANVIAAGGANVIAAGGANVIAAGGGNVIAAGGANMINRYSVQSVSSSAAQCKDPWVTQAVHEVMHRAPNGSGNAGECNIKRYGNGHWSSYPDLVSKVKQRFGVR